MNSFALVPDVLILLTASILIIVVLRKLKLSPVLGYLIVGALLGEYHLIKEPKYAHSLSEFGVIFLLFTIGLELTFDRLIKMRLHVFGFGGLQVLLTTCGISFFLEEYFKFSVSDALLIAASLALSSTAIVMQVLVESGRMSSQVGRLSLSNLLMQDFTVVPLLAIIPILASNGENLNHALAMSGFKALVILVSITIAGRLFLRPLFSIIVSANTDDVYVPTTLILVLGAALLTHHFELSTAMGAFLAGILIAETEYRNRVEESIKPFKSLFLGLFFMTVGMNIDMDFIVHNITDVLLAALALMLFKAFILVALCKLFKFTWGTSIHGSLLLCQGGEFAFILFGIASNQGILDHKVSQFLLIVVSVSMALTPLISILGARIEDAIDTKNELDTNQEFKGITDLNAHIIIAGFGRVGRVVAYMLEQKKIPFVAVDTNSTLVKKARKQGFPIYHGDLSHVDTLKAVGAERASALILTMNEKVSLRKTVKTAHIHYRSLKTIARAEDFRHGAGLRKLGANLTVPANIETGLQIGGSSLRFLGIGEHEIVGMKEKVRQNDYSLTEEIELFRGITQPKHTNTGEKK